MVLYDWRGPNVTAVPDVDHFEKEASCTYRSEDYRVRDNGAVFRPTMPEILERLWKLE